MEVEKEDRILENQDSSEVSLKKELGLETYLFPLFFVAFFLVFVLQMGLANTINTMMNTAYRLLIDTVLYITAVCVIMGAISAVLSEFGFVALINRLLQPLMKPIFGLPGVAALGVVTTFLSDNPAILTLAEDHRFRRYFKKYQLPAITNLGTAFGMGLIVCTFMYSLSPMIGTSLTKPVLSGLVGALIGSVISTRVMLAFTKAYYGTEENVDDLDAQSTSIPKGMRPIRTGGIGSRLMSSLLDGGHSGVKLGLNIIPGVLIICTIVLMLINGPAESGEYTGAAYEGNRLIPILAQKIDFILQPLFGFSSPEAIGVPVTALGSAGAALSITSSLLSKGLIQANDIAVFTAICMCWSGYLSTHASMMDSLNCKSLIGKAILSHTIGGLCAGIVAHWLYILLML
ncbi:MAG: hypothetical protein IJ875_01080 [Solobacterium sp.]|nr:hypothetical protein [Solobacterium sp.]